MALKDSIKHFRDVDNYETYVEKKDIDNNFDLLADTMAIVVDEDTIKQQDTDIKKVQFNNSTATEDYSFAWGEECEASGAYAFAGGYESKASAEKSFAFGYQSEASGYCSSAFGKECKASADYSIAIGNECEANGVYNFVYGYKAKTSGIGSCFYGFEAENKQDISVGMGGGHPDDNVAFQDLNHFDSKLTDDDTQTDLPFKIKLWIKSLNYITITGNIFQDDYSTKWIFERKLIVRIDDGGTITIDSDDNNDIVKDDDDWKFDIDSTDDDTDPYLTLKVTGKADTNINWGITARMVQTYWI